MTGRILIVDDIPHNVKLLEAKLRQEYYTTFSAYSGREALEMLPEVTPDIVLLDIMMPEMDGFEVCQHIKRNPETAHIPVVMVTALSEQEDRVRGLNVGATDFITKPVDEVHLFARVRSLIRVKMVLDELRMRNKTGTEFGAVPTEILSKDKFVEGRVLLVDDDRVQSKKIRKALEATKKEVMVIHPDDIDATLTSMSFDLIIMSSMLDDADGVRLGMHIRSREELRHIPILIIIDEDDHPLLSKSLEVGIDDYIIAPIDANELVARVRTQMLRKQYQDALRANYEETFSASVVDPLTGLYNRRYLDTHIQNIIDDAMTVGKDLSLMTIDIDHFKAVNDRPGWGHAIGDEVLKEVAEMIKEGTRSTDICARVGGEEFVIAMPNTSLDLAELVAERIRTHIADTPVNISASPGTVSITISAGVSTLNMNGDTAGDLIKRSDECLYQAKNSGRNRVISALTREKIVGADF